MNKQQELAVRFALVREQIAAAAKAAGREASDISLLPVSKTFSTAVIADAHALGEMRFGENKAQEIRDKATTLEGHNIDWVMIGYLQSNKARYVARYASEIQSLDRLSLAKTLQRRLELEDRYLNALVQVKTSTEPSKYGMAPDQVGAFIKQLTEECPRLRVQGLMTMAVNSADENAVRACFRALKQLQQQLQAELELPGVSLDRLSMGMSGDFHLAIEEGATEIRIGTAVFGHRQEQRDYYWPE